MINGSPVDVGLFSCSIVCRCRPLPLPPSPLLLPTWDRAPRPSGQCRATGGRRSSMRPPGRASTCWRGTSRVEGENHHTTHSFLCLGGFYWITLRLSAMGRNGFWVHYADRRNRIRGGIAFDVYHQERIIIHCRSRVVK